MEQRSDNWHKARLGKLTASRVSDAISMLKTGAEAEKRINYRLELASERLTGRRTEMFENHFMRWGTEYEPMARLVYAQRVGEIVSEIGFVDHPELDWAGASPDGLIDDDGLIEIKCPSSQTHITYLTERKIPTKYQNQMAWQLICTQRKWCDFVSFDPRMPDELQLMIVRYEPSADELRELESKARDFLQTVDDLMNKLEQTAIQIYREEAA
jgi:putative phage-type endonuclease